jgi:SAM-dependent methyltransferase
MFFAASVADQQEGSDNLSTVEHYKTLLHFARKMLQGDLVGGRGEEYIRAQEHYAHVVNDEVSNFLSLRNKKILDVGGLSGVFCRVFSEEFGAQIAVNSEPYHEYYKNLHWPNRVRGAAQALPFSDNQFDFVMCREVLEHIHPQYLQSAVSEMYRVTRNGGLCYISIPPWYNPVSGHALMPFHYLPFGTAKRLSLLFFRNPPINPSARSYAELPLFKITYKPMMRLISSCGFRVLATKDHHFRLHFLTKIPLIRDVAVPCIVFIARKPEG